MGVPLLSGKKAVWGLGFKNVRFFLITGESYVTTMAAMGIHPSIPYYVSTSKSEAVGL